MSLDRSRHELRQDYERLLQIDDRNIFGSEGLDLSASVRRRHQRDEPKFTTVRKLMKCKDFDAARALLEQCYPRHQYDELDPRYFGVYWTAGDLAQESSKDQEAVLHYIQALSRYPFQLRRNHLHRLEALGIEAACQRLASGGNLAETDAAAILHDLLALCESLRQRGAVILGQMQAAQKMYKALEHTGSQAVRSSRQR